MRALTSTHRQIANYIASGYSSKEISTILSIPTGTINNTRCHVLRYYNCSNAVQLAHRLLRDKQIGNIYGTI